MEGLDPATGADSIDDLEDPRGEPGFDPGLYPTFNGGPAPSPASTDPFEQACLSFLAAHYRMNRAQARRQTQTPGWETDLAAAQRTLGRLLDRHAPIGLWGEPTRLGPYVIDLRFVRPGLHPRLAHDAPLSSFHLATLPDGFPAVATPGAITIRRWRNGKVDL